MNGTKHWYTIPLSIGVIILSVYIYGTFYAPVQLRVVLSCIGNNTESTFCYDSVQGLTLINSQVEQSPKLKEALIKVLDAEPFQIGVFMGP